MTVLIRPERAADRARIGAILGRRWRPNRPDRIGATTLVAVTGGGVAGIVETWEISSKNQHIATLAVAAASRRQGIGTALLVAVADRLGAIRETGVSIQIAPGSAMTRDWLIRRGARMGPEGGKTWGFQWPDLAALGVGCRAARLAHLALPLALTAAEIPHTTGAPHPVPNGAHARGRVKQALGDVFGLSDFGVNRVVLAPGVWSSIPHRHSREDEFILVLAGTPTLVSGAETRTLHPGDCAGFPAMGRPHHLENRSDAPVAYFEIGSRRPEADEVDYPGEDLRVAARADGTRGFVRRCGTPVDDA